ncbi:EAL domain-containing protein [Chitinilyticum piscinae]|uniref:EAL domain-containing protein n=1 Tax=Chitinilyticum piscinae TaxID=2866724 RepID=A0A8J7FPK3_9NEIS|nr:EAL domain-containing protein [Chitinilyticum piscinae]MBE9608241.1 EAL domain-containing protein [Chitinilyticum piscinae]
MKLLSRLRFQQKISLSFGVLIALLALNALVGVVTGLAITRQLDLQNDSEQLTSKLDRMHDGVTHFVQTRAREDAAETFHQLDQVRGAISGLQDRTRLLGKLPPVLDEYRATFQKFVIELDQKAALESQASALSARVMNDIVAIRLSESHPHTHSAVDTLSDQVSSLLWQTQAIRNQPPTAATAQIERLTLELARLQGESRVQIRQSEQQRQIYRILRDAGSYLNSFASALQYQSRNRQTEQTLQSLSEQIQSAAQQLENDTRAQIRHSILLALILAGSCFVLTIIAAMLLARQLGRGILEPVRHLLGTTQAITAGHLDERAAVHNQDEIGELARSFNQMADSLGELQASLEQRVAERTRQLSESNAALSHEIRQRQHAEAEISERERHLRTIIDLVPHFIFARNNQGQYTLANQALASAYGTTPEQLLGHRDADFNRDAELVAGIQAADQEVIQSGKAICIPDDTFIDHTGCRRDLQTSKIPYQVADATHVLGVAIDITELKQHQSQLERIAHFDILTDLPNRVLLGDRLHQAMAHAQRHAASLAVVYLDLDGFKEINDSSGHKTGDRLLARLAARMKDALRDEDTLARLGGDEFVAVLQDLHDQESSTPILKRLLAAAAEPVHVDGKLLHVSASAGVTFFPQADKVDADQLLRQADQAMYVAKQAGKNRYHLFDAEQDRMVRGHHETQERIRQGLAGNEFVLHYQPKVNMRTGQVLGAEALLRWQHPQKGLLPPAEFLPAIDNHALGIQLGEWVLDTALAQISQWRSLGLHVPVSVNIDAIQFGQSTFLDKLRATLAAHPALQSGDLELEVLETSALEDIRQLSDIMLACRDLGVGFALDDFGTGYSSLTYLKQLPAQVLKIDQSFVRDMLDDPEDLAILEGVLGLATAFQRNAIAEGVETLAHGELLLQMGCEWAQGYAIARPMPAAAIPEWLARWQPPPEWAHCAEVRRDDLPLLFAAVDHRAWMAQLQGWLRGESALPPAAASHDCKLGHWLNGDGLQRHGSKPAFLELASRHEQLHLLGQRLIALKHTGQLHLLQTAQEELDMRQQQLQHAIQTLIRP